MGVENCSTCVGGNTQKRGLPEASQPGQPDCLPHLSLPSPYKALPLQPHRWGNPSSVSGTLEEAMCLASGCGRHKEESSWALYRGGGLAAATLPQLIPAKSLAGIVMNHTCSNHFSRARNLGLAMVQTIRGKYFYLFLPHTNTEYPLYLWIYYLEE